MKAMFPIPRITESFMDEVIENFGWSRYDKLTEIISGQKNADYLAPDSILELKIIEEEGLEKKERQNKIAELYNSLDQENKIVDISLERVPSQINKELKRLVSRPIQTAIKKASKQIKETKKYLRAEESVGVLIAVNNGYTYLNADNFEKIVVERCKNDSNNIDHAICITVEYHQGSFDTQILCKVCSRPIKSNVEWSYKEKFENRVQEHFNFLMTIMMRDLTNPNLWNSNLNPVSDIIFERDNVVYVREAPHVSDSRFKNF